MDAPPTDAPQPMGLKVLLMWGVMGVLGMLLADTRLGRLFFDLFLVCLGAAAVLRGTRLRPLLLCGAWLAFAAGSVALVLQYLG